MQEKESSWRKFVPGSSDRALHMAMKGEGAAPSIVQRVKGFVGRQADEVADRVVGRAGREADRITQGLPDLAGEMGKKFVRGGLQSAAVPAGVGLLAGTGAGYTINELRRRAKENPSMSEGHKYAGVTLDYYDDQGETLKALFPTPDELPDMIKSANVRPKEKLANEAFALIMLDQGHVFRKFACADAGTTMMSSIYFMEHGDKLTKEAQQVAATNLVAACVAHGIMPPTEMTKVAGDFNDSVVDVTGQSPEPKVVDDRPTNENEYAVKLADGSLHYPIDTWDRVKTAEAYFQDERNRMDPEIRRQYAVKLARQSYFMGYPLDKDIVELGALSYHSDGHLKYASEMRKAAFPSGSDEHEFLDEIFEKRSEIQPEVYAECLKRFDMMNGLDQGWDQVILDPWTSTFGVKTASVVWEDGADRVTEEELTNLGRNNTGHLEGQFTDHFALEFLKDPVGVFNSMPDPQKRIISRMAVDLASKGSSEFMPTKNDPGDGLGKKFKTTY